MSAPSDSVLKAREAEISRIIDEIFDKVDVDKVSSYPFSSPLPPSPTSADRPTNPCYHLFGPANQLQSGTIDLEEFKLGFKEHPDICNFFKQF